MIVNNIIDDNIIEYNVPDRAQDVDFGSGDENEQDETFNEDNNDVEDLSSTVIHGFSTVKGPVINNELQFIDNNSTDWNIFDAYGNMTAFGIFYQYFVDVNNHDEGMIKCTTKKCPILRVMPNKPISNGMKMFCIVDYATGVCIDFNMDDDQYTAGNFVNGDGYGVSG
jgi:hypothetical protein